MAAKSEFLVKVSAARMPSSCWGMYARVGVLECDPGAAPKMLSARARGVRRVVATWEKLHVGRTTRCAFQRALAEACAMAARLNKEVPR